MQQFTTRGVNHDFQVDGVTYYLPGIGVADFEEIAKYADLEPAAQAEAFRAFAATRARRRNVWRFWASPRSAVKAMRISDVFQLIAEWSGLGGGSGESSASPV